MRCPGRRDQAQALLKDLLARDERHPPARASIALVYVGLGHADQAMHWLERAYAACFNTSILLWADGRFRKLLDRLGCARRTSPADRAERTVPARAALEQVRLKFAARSPTVLLRVPARHRHRNTGTVLRAGAAGGWFRHD